MRGQHRHHAHRVRALGRHVELLERFQHFKPLVLSVSRGGRHRLEVLLCLAQRVLDVDRAQRGEDTLHTRRAVRELLLALHDRLNFLLVYPDEQSYRALVHGVDHALLELNVPPPRRGHLPLREVKEPALLRLALLPVDKLVGALDLKGAVLEYIRVRHGDE